MADSRKTLTRYGCQEAHEDIEFVLGGRATAEVLALYRDHLEHCEDCNRIHERLAAIYAGPRVPPRSLTTTDDREFQATLARMPDERAAPWHLKLAVRATVATLATAAVVLAYSLAGLPSPLGWTAPEQAAPASDSSYGLAQAALGAPPPGSGETARTQDSSIRHAAQAYGRVIGGTATLLGRGGSAKRSSTFRVGTTFEVDTDDSLQVGLLGKLVVNATPGSRLTWTRGSSSVVELRLEHGMVAIRYDRQDADPILQVRTPTALVRVVGTVFTVQVEDGDNSAVSVLRGQVEVLDPRTNRAVAEVESGDRYDVARGNYDTVGQLEVSSALPISKQADGASASAHIPRSWHVPGLPDDRAHRTLAYVPERSRGSFADGPSIRVGPRRHRRRGQGAGRVPVHPAPPHASASPVENDGDDLVADLMREAAALRRKELTAALGTCRDLYASNETRYRAATCIGEFLLRYDGHPVAAEAYLLRGMLRMDYALDYKTAEMDLRTYLRRAPNGRQAEKARYRLWLAATEDGRINEALKRGREYLAEYPNGHYVGKLIQRFPELKSAL